MDFLCFGGEDWWYHNRGHIDMQLMRNFSRCGTVLYINSIIMQKPALAQGSKLIKKIVRKSKSMLRSCEKTTAGFWAYSPVSLPVHHLPLASRLNSAALKWQIERTKKKLKIIDPIMWIACPAACPCALKISSCAMVYQKTDRYEEFPNVDAELIRSYDRTLMARANLTVFVNEQLYIEQKNLCRRAIYLDHGVDYEMFAFAKESGYIPDDIRGIDRPIVGFFGGIDDHTFDYPFMLEVIRLLPDVSFVFIGKASFECSQMKGMANVHMLGPKTYEQVPHYGKCFDVAIMPWRRNRWIQSCNPIKLKEYLALGKPTVSTPFHELNKYKDVIYEASSPDQFAKAILQALAENTAHKEEARRSRVADCSWQSKALVVLDELSRCCGLDTAEAAAKILQDKLPAFDVNSVKI